MNHISTNYLFDFSLGSTSDDFQQGGYINLVKLTAAVNLTAMYFIMSERKGENKVSWLGCSEIFQHCTDTKAAFSPGFLSPLEH